MGSLLYFSERSFALCFTDDEAANLLALAVFFLLGVLTIFVLLWRWFLVCVWLWLSLICWGLRWSRCSVFRLVSIVLANQIIVPWFIDACNLILTSVLSDFVCFTVVDRIAVPCIDLVFVLRITHLILIASLKNKSITIDSSFVGI